MPWFVPTEGDHEFLAVRESSLQRLQSPSRKLSALTGRLSGLSNAQARAVGRDLWENAALSAPPENLEQLLVGLVDDPKFAEAAYARGLASPYRVALPEEVEELEAFPLAMWPRALHEGGLA